MLIAYNMFIAYVETAEQLLRSGKCVDSDEVLNGKFARKRSTNKDPKTASGRLETASQGSDDEIMLL